MTSFFRPTSSTKPKRLAPSEIPASQPTIVGHHLPGGVGVPVIPLHHRSALHGQLAHLAVFRELPIIIQHSQLVAGPSNGEQRRAAGRPAPEGPI